MPSTLSTHLAVSAEGAASLLVDQAAIELQRLRAGARPQEIVQAQQSVEGARIARDKARLDADRAHRWLRDTISTTIQ